MTTSFDFAKTSVTHNRNYSRVKQSNNIDNYTIYLLDFFKLTLGLFFIVSSITGFIHIVRVINLYKARKQKLVEFYLEMVKKKNEFDYVSSPAYKEVRLRKLYGAYKKGEKLIIFTEDIKLEQRSDRDRQINPRELWIKLLIRGVSAIEK